MKAELGSPQAVPTEESAASTAQPAAGTAAAAKPRFLGLDAGNWISLTALAISLATVSWQIGGFITGPKVEFIPPTSVTFRYWPTGSRESLALSATTMNYVNGGRKEYDALVLSESVEITLPGRSPRKLHWWWFVGPTGAANEQAHPVVVPGAGLTAHETRFAPLLQPCAGAVGCTDAAAYMHFIDWGEFLALADAQAPAQEIAIKFEIRVREDRPRTVTYLCKAMLDTRTREVMRKQTAVLAELRSQNLKPTQIEEHSNFKEHFSVPCVGDGT